MRLVFLFLVFSFFHPRIVEALDFPFDGIYEMSHQKIAGGNCNLAPSFVQNTMIRPDGSTFVFPLYFDLTSINSRGVWDSVEFQSAGFGQFQFAGIPVQIGVFIKASPSTDPLVWDGGMTIVLSADGVGTCFEYYSSALTRIGDRYQAGLNSWQEVDTTSLGDSNAAIITIAEFNGSLYFGTINPNGGEIWKMDVDVASGAHSFQRVVSNGFGSKTNSTITTLAVHQGRLYAGTWDADLFNNFQFGGGWDFWSTADGLIWDPIAQNAFGGSMNKSLTALLSHNGYLYMGVMGDLEHEVWRWDGTQTEKIFPVGENNPLGPYASDTTRMTVFEDKLHFSSEAAAGKPGSPGVGGYVVRLTVEDPPMWEIISSPGFGNTFNHNVLIGTSPEGVGLEQTLLACTWNPKGFEVYRYQSDSNWTRLITSGFDKGPLGAGCNISWAGNSLVVNGSGGAWAYAADQTSKRFVELFPQSTTVSFDFAGNTYLAAFYGPYSLPLPANIPPLKLWKTEGDIKIEK